MGRTFLGRCVVETDRATRNESGPTQLIPGTTLDLHKVNTGRVWEHAASPQVSGVGLP